MVELKEAVWLVVDHFTWQWLTGQWRPFAGVLQTSEGPTLPSLVRKQALQYDLAEPMHNPVVYVVVLCTNKSQSLIF